MSEYLGDSMAWSLLGLVVGYLLGKTELTVRSLMKGKKTHDDS